MTEYKGYTFEYHHKFKKEFQKTFARHQCPTIKSDFKLLYDILIQHLSESDKFESHVCMSMAGLENYVNVPAFIIKKFRCEGINKGVNSGFRITFLFDKEESKFIFVELFMWQSGRRISSVQSPIALRAVLTGMGFTSEKSASVRG